MTTLVPDVFDQLSASIAFGPADHDHIRELAPLLVPHFERIAAGFCATIVDCAGHQALVIDWMKAGLTGPWDRSFYQTLTRIGHRHAELEIPTHLMIAAVSAVRAGYADVIMERLGAQAPIFLRSMDKLLDLELAVMQHACHRDTQARLVTRERRLRSEQFVAMQTLSAGLAHELRNPINSAKLQLEVLGRRLRKPNELHTLAEPALLASQELERLDALIDDFLVFAEPTMLVVEVHDLVAVVADALELEDELATRREVALILADAPEQLEASFDSAKITRVVQNLVRNAIEAVSVGGRVDICVARDADLIHVIVEDDGPGIPDAIRARMFEPFFSTKDTGTGLGMSIVWSLVTLHGGTIEVASSPTGTRCDVTLPHAARPLQSDVA
ncbi:MAG: ATP-binding protein [Proteobacteria bacterium]|nr:ATP-binding protein [Pseudomonadota bacterium]